MTLQVGVARVCITPYHGVELTGWGYYINRTWTTIRDHLYATALVLDDGERSAALIALDLMVIDEPFTRRTRQRIHDATGQAFESILLTCSHSHNAPAAGGLLGVGQCDPFYEDWASRQAATAAILAWNNRVEAQLSSTHHDLPDYTFNRTREDGPTDTRLTTLRVDRRDGSPLALIVNFGAHPTVSTVLHPRAVSRDVPGQVCDRIEKALPGAMGMYVQGACGDVNFLREFATDQRCHEPADALAKAALLAQEQAQVMPEPIRVDSFSMRAELPSRRWQAEEIDGPIEEARRRMSTDDVAGWRESLGRAMTNRPDDMVRRHGGDELKAVRSMARFYLEWEKLVKQDWQTRLEVLETEVQAVRIGELCIVANSSELFSAFALDLRRRLDVELMIACYANGRIGYVPDARDISVKSYAAYQSPKYCNQFPFTDESGPALTDTMVRSAQSVFS